MKNCINQLINEYQEYSLIVKSSKTCEYQMDQVRALQRYFKFKNITNIDEITNEVINDVVTWSRKTCRNITINKRITFLKQVFRYHKINHEYLLSFPKLKQEQKSYDIFPEEQLKLILNTVSNYDDKDPYMLTRKLIVFFLLDTGVRSNELVNIKIKNIDFKEQTILLETTKTDVERYVLFTHLTKDILKQYVDFYPEREYLFWNYISYTRYTYRHLEAFCEALRKETGIKKLHPHMFRHTMATSLVEDGCPIETVQKLLGHKDIGSTMIYLHMSLKKTKNDFEKHAYLNKVDMKIRM
jgi:site-specific recombinase XerD